MQVELDPDVGAEVEENLTDLQQWMGAWQALDPIGMYFAITRRAVTIIVDLPNEDAMFEAIQHTWVFTRSYPEVWPVADSTEFGGLMQRLGRVP